MRKTKGKTTRQLPTRGALNDVTKSPKSLGDYAKASPITPNEPTATVIQNLSKKRV
jgi:hypothetical protein